MNAFSCTCEKCVGACQSWPGLATPVEAMKAISVGLARRYMLGTYYHFGLHQRVDALSPATVGREGKRALNALAGVIRMPCTLLVDDRCMIHESGFKPQECRELTHETMSDDSLDSVLDPWLEESGRRAIDAWKYWNKSWAD